MFFPVLGALLILFSWLYLTQHLSHSFYHFHDIPKMGFGASPVCLCVVNSSPSMSYCSPRGLPKNWSFWTVVLEKTLESPLDCKEIQPVHFKGNQSWTFIGRTDIEAETPVLWPPDVKNWLIWKDADAGKDWRQEEKGMTKDEMVGEHHQLSGHEFE